MPREELARLWQQFLHAFAALLLQMRGDATSPAARKLVRLLPSCLPLLWFF